MSSSSKARLVKRFGGVVYNGSPPRTSQLHCSGYASGTETGIHFSLDESLEGHLAVGWGDVGGIPSASDIAALNLSLAVLVAQHCLPETLDIDATLEVPKAAMPALRRLLAILYDVRCFCDETPYRTPPELLLHGRIDTTSHHPSDRRALVLLSGGFDSTLACLALLHAGYEVQGLHIRTNRHVEAEEQRAAQSIARALGVPLTCLSLRFPDQERLGRHFSRSFGEYPFYNSVPHGRDFPLAVIAAILAKRLRCGLVAFGHEKESRHKIIADGPHRIYRHDVESAYGRLVLQRFIRDAISPEIRLLSPIAGVSVYSVRRTLYRRFPDLVPLSQSCFWGRRCEKCIKCLSTFAIQRDLGLPLLAFADNLFANPDDDDMRLFANPDRPSGAIGYGPFMHHIMTRLVTSDRFGADDYWLHEFRQLGLPRIRGEAAWIVQMCERLEHPAEVPAPIAAAVSELVA